MAANTLLKIVFVGLFVTFLLILVTGIYAVKLNNGETCGFDKISTSSFISDVEYYVFNDTVNSLLTSVPKMDNNNYVYYDFCVRGNATDDLLLNVVNGEGNVLGNIYFVSGAGTYCTNIVNSSDYLGVTCVNCDSTTNLTVYQSIATNIDTNYLLINFNDDPNTFILTVDNNPLSYNLYGASSCKEIIKSFVKYYLSVIGVLLLLFLILLGANSMENNLVNVFGDDNDDE